MKTNAPLNRHHLGFSLIEVLVVVVLIAVLLLGAIPTISSVIDQSKEAQVLSNARHLAEVANLAISAGSEPLLAAANKEDVVRLLRTGVYGDGQFASNHFQVALAPDEATAAMSRLSFANGVMSLGIN